MPAKRSLRPGDQRGSVTLEMVVVYPLLMLLVWVGMQLVLAFFANRVALSAAQEGVRTARDRTGSTGAAERHAQRYLDQLGDMLLLHPRVRATRTPDVARVKVTGQAQQLIPLVARLRVVQVAESPRQRFRPEAGGFADSQASSDAASEVVGADG